MGVIWAAILVIAATSRAAPAVRYDQRQEGDVNVRADLENFVVLIIPTSGSSSSPASPSTQGSAFGLLDLLSKAVPAKGHSKNQKSKKVHQHHHAPIDTTQFLESKTAPYHVDISRQRNHLAKLHPDREVVIAESPAVSLGKAQDLPIHARRSKTVSIEVPVENETVKAIVVSPEDIAMGRVKLQVTRNDTPQKTEPQETLTLLGAQLEQCGPGLQRDANGICQTSS